MRAMTPTRSTFLAAVSLLLVVVLGAVRWWLAPERGVLWAVIMFALPLVWVGLARPRWRPGTGLVSENSGLNVSVATAAGLFAAALAMSLARAYGVLDHGDTRRIMGLILGSILVAVGNSLPKQLTPIARMSCDPARKQALQRFAGWTFVVTGIAYAAAWLVAPRDSAGIVAAAIGLAGTLIVLVAVVRVAAARGGA